MCHKEVIWSLQSTCLSIHRFWLQHVHITQNGSPWAAKRFGKIFQFLPLLLAVSLANTNHSDTDTLQRSMHLCIWMLGGKSWTISLSLLQCMCFMFTFSKRTHNTNQSQQFTLCCPMFRVLSQCLPLLDPNSLYITTVHHSLPPLAVECCLDPDDFDTLLPLSQNTAKKHDLSVQSTHDESVGGADTVKAMVEGSKLLEHRPVQHPVTVQLHILWNNRCILLGFVVPTLLTIGAYHPVLT